MDHERTAEREQIVPAVGVVCLRGEDVLLIRRGQPPLSGSWSLPGGRIEFGETAEGAALRELKEETGVEAVLCGLIDVVDGIFTSRRSGDTTRHYLLCDYAARWVSGDTVAGDDAADAKFVSPEELQSIDLWHETRRIIDAARALV
ncbi:MAG: NUDIX hydrolase [Pseudomonadota bacterium]